MLFGSKPKFQEKQNPKKFAIIRKGSEAQDSITHRNCITRDRYIELENSIRICVKNQN